MTTVQEHNDDTHERLARIETILAERDKALTAAFLAQQGALNLATKNLELRLEKLNELRQEVTQDRASYITRDKFEAFDDGLTIRLTALENFRGKAMGFGALIALLSGVAGAVIQKLIGG